MLGFWALVALGANIMASPIAFDSRVDRIYRVGPEDLVAATRTIVAGPVAGYSKEARRYSELGPNGFPLEWLASGRIDKPRLIKGDAVPGPVPFSRIELSVFVPIDADAPIWERDFGEISPNGQVVVFLNGGGPSQASKALPSGDGEQDLIDLVKMTVEIQAIRDPMQQRQAWLRSLITAQSDEERRAALRSVARSDADFNQIAPSLKTLLSNPGLSRNIKAFAFGLVAFYVTERKWAKEINEAIGLLCEAFASQREPKLEIDYLQSIKLILRYTAEEPLDETRQPVRKRVMDTVEQRASLGLGDPTLKEEYKRIRAQYGNR